LREIGKESEVLESYTFGRGHFPQRSDPETEIRSYFGVDSTSSTNPSLHPIPVATQCLNHVKADLELPIESHCGLIKNWSVLVKDPDERAWAGNGAKEKKYDGE
jgi:hypothetical protein